MARNQHARVFVRTMPEIITDAMVILREDASEYGFIGLAGGASAGITVLLLGLVGGPIALALIPPALIVVAVAALATSSAAVGAGVSSLQPDASRAFADAARRGVAVLRPWLPLAVALAVASYAAAALSRHMGPIPADAVVLPLVAISALYALPRGLCCTALFEYDLSMSDALAASSAIVRMMTRAVVTAWCIVLAPAMLALALGAMSGIDIVTGAVAAVFFVGAMPAAAALMSLLFREAAESARRP